MPVDGRFRHELKFTVNAGDVAVLRSRLGACMARDSHNGGVYKIRSLYFDDPWDSALNEKLDGVDEREKFRIRCYNGDDSFLRLEKKMKRNGLCKKLQAELSRAEVERILAGDAAWMADEAERPLLQEFYCKLSGALLQPKTLVDYRREAFVEPLGNVRVTLDTDIRSGVYSRDFFDPAVPMLPVSPLSVLEVKYDAFLPAHVAAAVQLSGRMAGAFSKYAACRIYG